MSEPRYHYTSNGKRFVALVLSLVFLAGGLFLEIYSFRKLREKRRLARLTTVKVREALPGEVKLKGKAAADQSRLLTSPHAKARCIYYRFLEEVEKKDSEGKTSWRTVRDETDGMDFSIGDETGHAEVRVSEAARFHVKQSHRQRRGKRRFTEWRIDPGDRLTVIGFAERGKGAVVVGFDTAGDYVPMISEYSDAEEQSGRGMGSVLMTWGGLTCLSFAVLGFFPVFRAHRLLAFLGALTIVQTGVLGFLGLKLIGEDLGGAAGRGRRHEQALKREITANLARHGITWSGEWSDLGDLRERQALPVGEAERLSMMRLNLARSQTRIAAQRGAFPEFLLAPLMGIPRTTIVPLPAADVGKFEELESRVESARLFTGRKRYLGWGLIAAGLLVTVFATRGGIGRIKIKRCIENVPTSRSTGVAFGLAEVAGTVETLPDSPAERGPLSLEPCVYYRYLVKERRGSGKNAKWVTIEDRTHSQLFRCRDRDGAIKVFPYGAEFVTATRSSRREGRLKYIEYRIRDRDPVYVLGQAEVDPFTGDSLMLVEPPGKEFPFIVSNCPESEIVIGKAIAGMAALGFAFSGLMLAILFAFGMAGSFAPTDYLFAAMIGPLFLGFVTVVLHYNDLVFLRRRVDRNWSNIDVALKKRHDLIPAIERVVSGFLAHEQDLQRDVAEMRSQWGRNPTGSPERASRYLQSEARFTTRFLGLREDYPDLKGNTVVAQVTKTLVEVENEISLMREGFNDAVQTYNTRIETIPDVFLARPFGFQPHGHLQFESAIIDVPDVRIGSAAGTAPAPSPTGLTNKTFKTRRQPKGLSAKPVGEEKTGPAQPEPVRVEAVPERVQPPEPIAGQLLAAAREPAAAHAVLIGLILLETRFEGDALPALEAEIGDVDLVGRVRGLRDELAAVDDRMKLPLVDECLPALRRLPDSVDLFTAVKGLIEWDNSISLFEYTLLQIFEREHARRAGEAARPIVQYYSYASLDPEISRIVSFLALLGRGDAEAGTVFETCRSLENRYLQLESFSLDECGFDQVDDALNKLVSLDRMNRRKLVETFADAIAQLDQPTADQGNFLRAVKERLRDA